MDARPDAASFTIPATHPALPGHFPGNPIVPGVVVIDHVLGAWTPGRGAAVRLSWVKFTRPLLPGELADIEYRAGTDGVRFTVSHAGEVLATGLFRETVEAPE